MKILKCIIMKIDNYMCKETLPTKENERLIRKIKNFMCLLVKYTISESSFMSFCILSTESL